VFSEVLAFDQHPKEAENWVGRDGEEGIPTGINSDRRTGLGVVKSKDVHRGMEYSVLCSESVTHSKQVLLGMVSARLSLYLFLCFCFLVIQIN
jgi:hypothetical protein